MTTYSRSALVQRFQEAPPYREGEFRSRAWGHPLHSLCSYQGKFKPAMAHWLVDAFTPPGGSVLDPLSGVGTVPFEAALTGRTGVANDMSPLAAIVSEGKLRPMSTVEAARAIDDLEIRMKEIELTESDFQDAQFGLNATVADYYHPETLQEVLRARAVLRRDGVGKEAFIWASLLHVLHGNRPYALSRTSHPITPFAPKGEAVYKSVTGKVAERVATVLRQPLPSNFTSGVAYHGDFRDLPTKTDERFDSIITSPPFIGMRFDRPNWLRLWFCGWGASDFHETSKAFLERQQTTSRECYRTFFDSAAELIKPDGLVIVHVGSGGRGDLVGDLRTLATQRFRLLGEVVEDVRDGEAHGLSDKGLTTAHHLLFLEPL